MFLIVCDIMKPQNPNIEDKLGFFDSWNMDRHDCQGTGALSFSFDPINLKHNRTYSLEYLSDSKYQYIKKIVPYKGRLFIGFSDRIHTIDLHSGEITQLASDVIDDLFVINDDILLTGTNHTLPYYTDEDGSEHYGMMSGGNIKSVCLKSSKPLQAVYTVAGIESLSIHNNNVYALTKTEPPFDPYERKEFSVDFNEGMIFEISLNLFRREGETVVRKDEWGSRFVGDTKIRDFSPRNDQTYYYFIVNDNYLCAITRGDVIDIRQLSDSPLIGSEFSIPGFSGSFPFNTKTAMLEDKLVFSNVHSIGILNLRTGESLTKKCCPVSNPVIGKNSTFIRTEDGISCIELDDFSQRWKTYLKLDENRKTFFAYSNDYLYLTSSNSIYAIKECDGEIVWTGEIKDEVCCEPVIYNGRLFVGTEKKIISFKTE